MKLFDKKRPERAAAVQLRDGGRQPFGELERYVPLRNGEIGLYRAIREAVPIVDAAVLKLIRLVGGVSAKCGDDRAQEGLERFLRTVDVGRGQRGFQGFLDLYLDSLLTCGRAVGEIVMEADGAGIRALLCGSVADLEVREGDSPLDFKLCARREGGIVEELPWQELLLFTPFQPEPDSPYGVSLLRSMPFLTGILLKIYQAIGMNWERMGNVRFAVVMKQGGDGVYAQARCEQVAAEWSAAMQSTRGGSVRDFVAVGDVDIKVIGADNQVLDSQVPVRQILEQLVAQTGIPPFLLGLSWSSTERMSAQQADMLTSELAAMRTRRPTTSPRSSGLSVRVGKPKSRRGMVSPPAALLLPRIISQVALQTILKDLREVYVGGLGFAVEPSGNRKGLLNDLVVNSVPDRGHKHIDHGNHTALIGGQILYGSGSGNLISVSLHAEQVKPKGLLGIAKCFLGGYSAGEAAGEIGELDRDTVLIVIKESGIGVEVRIHTKLLSMSRGGAGPT